MKNFNKEIERFFLKLQENKPFAFSKYADGEWLAIKGVLCSPGNGEWDINHSAERARELLIESFVYQDPGYYIGISCPCCQGQSHYDMVNFSKQDNDHLTFANLFVNANYNYFITHFIPDFAMRDNIVLIANRGSDLSKLPFKVQEFHGVGFNAWVDDLHLINELINKQYSNKTILFSCGPLGNILIHQLWKMNKSNICIDIGSTIDLWLNNDIRNKRCYALGIPSFANQVCVWGN